MSDVVDLTLDSEEDSGQLPAMPQPKRRRTGPSFGSRAAPAADEEVVVVEQAREEPEGLQRALGEDEDLAVVGERGEVWNKDLPHSRDLCGKVAFRPGRNVENKKHCDKCYCYVCDVPASQCGEWGSGTSFACHCNAHSGSDFYVRLKQQRARNREVLAAAEAAAAAARGMREEAAALAARLAGYGEEDEDEGYGDEYDEDEEGYGYYDEEEEDEMYRLLAGGVPFLPGFGRRPGPQRPAKPAVCNLKAIPDPSGDRDLMLLARVEVAVKAMGDNTIRSLQQRLQPSGFYVPVQGAEEYANKLCIDNLFEQRWDMNVHKSMPVNLKFKKMPLEEAAPQDDGKRIRQVTIFHYDGRKRPTTYGLQVDKEATISDICTAAAPFARLDPAREQLVAMQLGSGLSASFLQPTERITDYRNRTAKIGLWRVPKSSGGTSEPNYAVVFHRKPTGGEYPPWEAAAPPMLLPLGSTLANGGKVAERGVLERMLGALAPLRKPPAEQERARAARAPDPAKEAKRLVDAGLHLCRTSTYGCQYTSTADQEFHTTKPYNSASRYGDSFFRDGKVYLRLDWTPEELGHFDTHAWNHPEVHHTASPEAMQPTLDLIKRLEEYASKKAVAKSLPNSMLEELRSAARCGEPGVLYPVYRNIVEPLVRVVLTLVPDSEAEGEKRGKARFSVYVWRSERGVVPHRMFFRPHDSWDSGRSSRHAFAELGSSPLRSTMEVMLWGNAQYKQMKARVEEWRNRAGGQDRSIPGLMKALERGELPAAQQPAGLTVTMRPYQLQSLQFMLDCERKEGGFRSLFWQRLATPDGVNYWWSALLGRACLDVPDPQRWGGWCAEEMGLGKTVEVLGLILANPAPPLPAVVKKNAEGLIPSRATLVVCAVSLVGQWIAEAQSKLGGSLRMHMYHGQGRIRDPMRLATEFDLVVTTYATLGADFGGKKNTDPKFPPLGSIKWHRLVLDEAHVTKNAAVGHSKACVALKADRRWLCTGTPINTDVGDLFGQFCVLGMAPFNNKTFYDTHVKHAYGSGVFAGGCPALVYALGQCMIRHTKRQVLGGEEVLRLPPKTEETVEVVLTESEQAMYKEAHAKCKALFQQYRALGHAQINKHLLQIMALLLPMRRVCSGGNLRRRDLEVADPLFGEGAGVRRRRLSGVGAGGGMAPTDHSLVAPEEECSICLDVLEQPSVTPCNHWFCRECILGVLANRPRCPLCRRDIAMSQLRQGITAAEADAEEAAAEAAAAAAVAAAAGGGSDKGKAPAGEGGEGEGQAGTAGAGAAPGEPVYVSESKLQALLKELRAMRRADPTAKCLIFSQYVSTIEWLKLRLTAAGFGYRYISGSMPLKQRAKAIDAFQRDPPTTVFLLSMRSGSVGINLTAASHVFLMEPALNPALEEQAIGRAWRMGQQRGVTVKKFYVKGSVEEHIMEVVKQRQGTAAGANAGGGAAGAGSDSDSEDEHGHMGWGGGGRPRTNVRMQDLVGSIRADRQELRVGELEVLFQDPDFPPPRVPESDSEDEQEEAELAAAAAAASRPGTSAAHAAMGGGPRRGRGRPPRVSAAAAAAAAAAGGSEEQLGRGMRQARSARKAPSYAEWAGEEEEEEEGEAQQGVRPAAAAAAAAAGYQQQQQQQRGEGGGNRKGKRRRSSSDGDEEWRAPSPGEGEVDSLGGSDDEEEDDDYLSAEDEDEDSPAPTRRTQQRSRSRSLSTSTAPRRVKVAAAVATAGWQSAPRAQQQQQQQQQQQPSAALLPPSSLQQQQQQQSGAAAKSSGGGSGNSGRLSMGAAAAAAVPVSALGAGGNGQESTPRMRVPMRGARLPTALTSSHLASSAGRLPGGT